MRKVGEQTHVSLNVVYVLLGMVFGVGSVTGVAHWRIQEAEARITRAEDKQDRYVRDITDVKMALVKIGAKVGADVKFTPEPE